ncbi:MAG: DNA repair protein RecO [Coriobacteriaceae bacterium]|nr:DNA repair protein RecO [Coriobacteriaceae bacterium]
MAGSRTYRTKAIVLDKTKLKETDLILTLMGESGRQIRAVAKGARKPGSRLAARCDLCCEVDVLLAHGRSLDIVSQADLVNSPLGAQPSYELLSAASAAAEVAQACTYEDADDPFVYAMTRAFFGQIPRADAVHLDLLLAAYVFKLLCHLGYRPDYSSCVACEDERPTCFSAQMGGLLCASCAATIPGCEQVDEVTVRWLTALIGLRFDELATAVIDPLQAARLLSFAHVWAATHLDCRLRAFEFLLGR